MPVRLAQLSGFGSAPPPETPTLLYRDYVTHLQAISAAASIAALGYAFAAAVAPLSYSCVVVCIPAHRQSADGPWLVLFERSPAGFLDQYLARRSWIHDPVIALSRRTTDPFAWSQAYALQDTPEARGIREAACSFGLHEGLALQLIGGDGRRMLVSIAGAQPKTDIASRAAVELFAHAMRRRADQIGCPIQRQAQRTQLTARETEVLMLISHGATDKQVAAQLGIHERTVGKHATRILEKLSCHSRTEAVAQALRHCLII